MSCCGKQRTNWKGESPRILQAQPVNTGVVYFRYVGSQTITVVGSATGRTYKFSGAGATVAADARDAPYIAGIPLMEQVSDLKVTPPIR
jgi:hypothetical protein